MGDGHHYYWYFQFNLVLLAANLHMKSLTCIFFVVLVLFFARAVYAKQADWVEPVTGMAFISVPKGCFQMGTSPNALDGVGELLQPFRDDIIADEQPQHEVCLNAFWIGKTEVTASDWLKVMGESPSTGEGQEPAGSISFEEANKFAKKLTSLSKMKYHFRLPTEAEWEYACRANESKNILPYRANKIGVAHYSVNGYHILKPAEVGQLEANTWGLFDMLGNVWEWTSDAYQSDAYQHHPLFNPKIEEAEAGARAIRGASHRSNDIEVRCGNRSFYSEKNTLSHIGLRLVRE